LRIDHVRTDTVGSGDSRQDAAATNRPEHTDPRQHTSRTTTFEGHASNWPNGTHSSRLSSNASLGQWRAPTPASSLSDVTSPHVTSAAASEPRAFSKVRQALLAALPCQDDIRILLTRVTNVSALSVIRLSMMRLLEFGTK
jgi:hypothetical protein